MIPPPHELARRLAAVRSAIPALAIAEPAIDVIGEDAVDQAVHVEGHARAAQIEWLASHYPDWPIGVMLSDGTVVTYCDHPDGLCVIASENVYKVD
jgi:hypothetical protein